MRVKFIAGVLVIGLVVCLLGPSTGQSQPPRGGADRGGRGGRTGGFGQAGVGQGGGRAQGGARGGQMDPDRLFDFQANGGETIKIADMRFGREQAEQWAKQNKVTNGELTREQYREYAKSWTAGAQGGASPAGPGGTPGTGGIGGGRGGSGGNTVDINRLAEERFKWMDRNGDGQLQYEEMSESLQAERDKWDTNEDGLINLEEFKEYMRAFHEKRQAERGEGEHGRGEGTRGNREGPGADLSPERQATAELDKKVLVLRAGRLGDKMPAWFNEYDTDPKDAQIALWEWKEQGQTLEEFRKWDLNGDGFITPDEVLRKIALDNALAKEDSPPSGVGRGGPGGVRGATGGGRQGGSALERFASMFQRGGQGGGAPSAGAAGGAPGGGAFGGLGGGRGGRGFGGGQPGGQGGAPGGGAIGGRGGRGFGGGQGGGGTDAANPDEGGAPVAPGGTGRRGRSGR